MRERQKKAGLPIGYDGPDRTADPADLQKRIDAGEPYTIRLRVDREATTVFEDLLRGEIKIENRNVDDQVLLKSDGFPTYHLANVVDDHEMGITHVLRAEEWISSTPKHVMLYRAFGWEPPTFCHLPLLRNSDKSKISKRKNPTSLDYYREGGYLPEAMVNFLALMGFSPGEGEGEEIHSLEELVQSFDPKRISLGGPVFDLTKLEWLNGAWIRRLEDDDLIRRILEFLPEGHQADANFVRAALPLVRERMKTLHDFAPWTDFFFVERVEFDQDSFRRTKLEPRVMRRLLKRCQRVFESVDDIQPERDEAALRQAADELGLKMGKFFMTLRVALTGKSVTPPLLESMVLLGREQCLARLDAAIQFLRGEDPDGDL